MRYAEVAVNFPGSRSLFCYAIPSQLDIALGQAVLVPFGSRIVQGIAVKLSDQPSVEETKEIADTITSYPLLSPVQIELAQWISQRYISPFFDALALMLPPGFERRLVTYFQPVNLNQDSSSLTSEQERVLHLIEERKKLNLRELENTIGKSKTRQITAQLLRRRLIAKNQELEKTKVKPKMIPYVKLAASKDELDNEIARLQKRRAFKQRELLEFLTQQNQAVAVAQVRKQLDCSLDAIKALEKRHLLSLELVNIRRDPLSRFSFKPSSPPVLTLSQQAAWESMRQVTTSPSLEPNRETMEQSLPPCFLLFGVTGSGKTEIYLRALAQVIAQGKRGICLVPEIALTPQTVERFASRFPKRVAVLHSGLSLGEQFDEWQRIKEGSCDVVIGARSALFAPQPDLGLIIIDEEHEWTYKQEDKSPRYHAREVALKLGELSGAAVILGSATPDLESFHRAQSGKYKLIELRERITPRGYSPLPEVRIVDLKEELKAGNDSLFSRPLVEAMRETIAQGEQIILFLNRRGTATFVQCRKCGFAFRCPRCSVALTYHSVERSLICHRCHYTTSVPRVCPQCLYRRIRFLGVGTQRVEEKLRMIFPQARLLRWDRDVTTRRYAHEQLLSKFQEHKADILIGTQMIAKGLDLPHVTLAGIISADTGLNFPDFRSGERTFQLLCQVAGRAGRGLKAGKVIIQTYSPENYAIQAAANHDYLGFYGQEIKYRHQYDYPPFSQLIRLVYTHTNNDLCRREAERVSQLILTEKDSRGLFDLSLIGPVPAFAFRSRGRYRWQLILKGRNPRQALSNITLPQGWIVDIDPVGIV